MTLSRQSLRSSWEIDSGTRSNRPKLLGSLTPDVRRGASSLNETQNCRRNTKVYIWPAQLRWPYIYFGNTDPRPLRGWRREDTSRISLNFVPPLFLVSVLPFLSSSSLIGYLSFPSRSSSFFLHFPFSSLHVCSLLFPKGVVSGDHGVGMTLLTGFIIIIKFV